jgi:hypothetical protein
VLTKSRRVAAENGLNLYTYTGNDPVNGEDPTGELCVSGANGSDDFCSRSRVYAAVNEDDRVSSKTSFFAAAAIVTNTLGGAPQSDFQHKLSADLEKANLDRANEIRAGTRYATGSIEEHNRDFVHFEQSHVQAALDGLQTSDPEGYKSNVDAANSALNGPIGLLAKATDPSFAAAVAATRSSLGHAIDFARQKDREALGNTIAAAAAKAQLTCIGSLVGACGY